MLAACNSNDSKTKQDVSSGASYGYVPGKFKTPEPDGYKLVGFKEIYSKWDAVFAEKGWGTFYLGNHDQPRMV